MSEVVDSVKPVMPAPQAAGAAVAPRAPVAKQAAPRPAVREDPEDILITSASPHIHDGSSVRTIMRDVLLSLVPCTLAAFYYFGHRSVYVIGVCVIVAVLTEWLCRLAMRRENTIGDLSAALTGLLLGLILPVGLPLWQAALGSVFAIAVGKQVFGGIGYNPFNPALVGRAFLLISFTAAMTTWSPSSWLEGVSEGTFSASRLEQPAAVAEAMTSATPGYGVKLAPDATTTATPLGITKEATKFDVPASEAFHYNDRVRRQLFLGCVNGSLGETSALAVLLGLAWLLIRRVISWHIPVAYLGTMAVFTVLMNALFPLLAMPVDYHLLAGGALFGAVFMATDMVTSPVTQHGRLVFGAGCGLLTMLIRVVPSGAYPEGVTFAILIMNAFTPLINRATRYSRFGTGKRAIPKEVA